jgi:hypothetical protein
VQTHAKRGEYVTGLIYCDGSSRDMHSLSGTVQQPLIDVPYEKLTPGSARLKQILSRYR